MSRSPQQAIQDALKAIDQRYLPESNEMTPFVERVKGILSSADLQLDVPTGTDAVEVNGGAR
jgi:hypothetical protein